MANLVEAYKKRIAISEQVYSKAHSGERLSNNSKLVTARCLANVENFINESFDNSVGTQRSAMGEWKKFCLNLVTIALPNLIANDIVIVSPMSSMTGYIAYVDYVAGSNKSGRKQGDSFMSPFAIGDMDGDKSDYTNAKTVDYFDTFTSGTSKLTWGPVLAGSIRALDADGNEVSDNATTAWTAAADGTVTAGAYVSGKSATNVKKIAYIYDNVVIPQNDLPTINAEVKSIALQAHARRIAIYFSQMAAFQAKTDYGFDLGAQLAEKAVGELSYEIDTEVTNLLVAGAEHKATMDWSKTLPVGVSKQEHYQGFAEVVELAKAEIYRATKKFAPNYMLVAPDVLPVLSFINGYTAASVGTVNGPYLAGTLNGLKVFVTPNITAGTYVIGVNGSDLMSSAAVYAPYMPIVPTQLLQFADGATSQGFSTMYDLKLLNTYEATDGNGVYTVDGTGVGKKVYSRLLVKGQIV